MTIETIATNTTDNTEEMNQLVDEHCIEIKDNMKSAQKKFIRLCEMILEKGYSPGEAWIRIKENLKECIPERTLYRWADTALPEESKLVTKPKKIANWQSPKQETKPELPNNDWLYNRIDVLKRENAHLKTQLQLPTNDSDVQQIPIAVEQPGPKEIQGRHNIAPEDYEINKLDQYDRDLLVNIIRYLHNKIQALKKDNTTATPSTDRKDWLLGK